MQSVGKTDRLPFSDHILPSLPAGSPLQGISGDGTDKKALLFSLPLSFRLPFG